MIKTKEILVNWGVNASMAPLLVVTLLLVAAMAALALVVVGVVAVFNAIAEKSDDGKKAFEQASKAAQSATEEFNRLKEANEELKKSFEDYDKAQDAIENMTKGTEEWKQAIADANMQVVDLIDKYPELAQYVENINGQLKISEEGQEALSEASEERVDMANRTRLVANAQKLEAENSMIAQKGSTDYLSKISFGENWWDKGTLYLEESKRDKIYQNAIDAMNESGYTIASSYDTFSAAMKEKDITDKRVIDALWEQKDALKENAVEVAANTKAIQLQREQTVRSKFEGTDIYDNASDEIQTAVDKIASTKLDTKSEKYKDVRDRYYTKGFLGLAREEYLADWELKDLGEDYATQMGINYSSIKTDDNSDLITFLDANGNEITKIVGDAAIAAIANEEILDKFDITSVVEALEKQGQKLSKGMREASATFVKNGEKTFDALTELEFKNKLSNITSSSSKEDIAKAMGFENVNEMTTYAEKVGLDVDEYVNSIKTAATDYQYELENIGKGMAEIVKKAFTEEGGNIGQEYSLSMQKSLADSLQYVFSKAGSEGVNALKEVVKNANLSEEDLGKVTSIVNSIDWKMDGALNEFRIELEKQGIIINENDDYWSHFINTMDKASNSAYTLSKGFDTIKKSLNEINSLTKELKLGEIVDDEAYNKLVKYNKEFENSFVKTLDGWIFLGSSEELIKQAKENQFNEEDFRNTQKERKTDQAGFKWYYNQEQSDGTSTITEGNFLWLMDNILSENGAATKYLNLLESETGYSIEEIKRAFYEGGYFTGNATDEANTVMKAVFNDLFKFANTDIDKETEDTLTGVLIDEYSSYSALVKNKDSIISSYGEKAFNNAAKGLLAREAGELGIDSETWATITENTDFEGQNKVLQNEHKRNLYQEIDMYAEINRDIEKINEGIDDWKDKLGTLSAGELITEYKKIPDIFKSTRLAADALFNEQQKEFKLDQKHFDDLLAPELSSMGITLKGVGTDGTYDLSSLYDAVLANPGNIRLRAIYDELLEYNEKVLDVTEERADTIAESYKDQLDMTIEAFNKKAEIRIDMENAIKDLAQFKRELDKTGWAKFEDPDALVSYANALADYGLDSASLQTAINAVKAFSGGTGNRADFTITNTETGETTFNKTAYKEAYDAAIDRAKETYEAVMEDLQTMYDSYFTAQEELVELYESQINKLTNINNLLSSQVEINKLLKKNTGESSVLMAKLYSDIAENRKKSYDLAVSELNALQKEYDKARESGNDEMVRQTEENMVAAAEAVASASQEMFNALNEEFSALLSATVDDFLVAAASADLSTITEDWQREIAKDERYLDDINASFGISELMRKFDKSIDENDSYTAQKKLLEQRTKQEEKLNKILEERGKISQYELDRANAEYELTLKQIALEEAQRTASKMKLVRGADGNYSYQYVQDEDAVAEAQAELNAAQNELYNLDKDRNKDLVDDFYSTLSEMNEAVAAAGNDPERQKAIKEYYQGILGDIISELGVAGENFEIMGLALGGDNWTSPLQNYTNAIREMNLEELFVDIDSLIGTFGDQTETIKNSLEILVGDSSPLTTAITSLDNSLLSATDLAVEEVKLAELTNDILKELPNVQDYANTLKKYIEDYQKYLESYTGVETDIEDNTEALRALTVAILNNTDMLDSKLDGQLNGETITYNNYQFKDDSWMYYDQTK